MVQIHCHQCGGFIGEPDTVSHRRPSGTILLATGRVPRPGVVSPESLDPGPVMDMLRERGVEVRERITWDRPLR